MINKNALNIKKKYLLTNRTPKERILRRILDDHEKRMDTSSTLDKLTFTSNNCNEPMVDETTSIDLTDRTSHCFEDEIKKR